MRAREEDAAALDALFRKEYFERVWCIQEAAAAGDIVAKCEDLEIDFHLLLLNVPLIIEYRGLTPDTSGLRMWFAMRSMKGEEIQGRSGLTPAGSLGPILQVLLMIKNMKATNPVDKLWALLGCTDEGLQPLLGGLNTFNGPKQDKKLALVQKGAIWLAKKVNSLGPDMDFGRVAALKPNYDNHSRHSFTSDFSPESIFKFPLGTALLQSHSRIEGIKKNWEKTHMSSKIEGRRMHACVLGSASLDYRK